MTPWTVACQAPLSIEFSRQEYWSWLPFPPPGDHPFPGIEPPSPVLQVNSLPTEPPGRPWAWFQPKAPESLCFSTWALWFYRSLVRCTLMEQGDAESLCHSGQSSNNWGLKLVEKCLSFQSIFHVVSQCSHQDWAPVTMVTCFLTWPLLTFLLPCLTFSISSFIQPWITSQIKYISRSALSRGRAN